MSAFAIIRNAPPVPPRKGRKPGQGAIYPFADMAVGDAFDVPRDGKRSANGGDQVQARVSAAAIKHTQRYGGKFTVRILDENTVRCWRIA